MVNSTDRFLNKNTPNQVRKCQDHTLAEKENGFKVHGARVGTEYCEDGKVGNTVSSHPYGNV